jgi:PAS domain S-box-containing protein
LAADQLDVITPTTGSIPDEACGSLDPRLLVAEAAETDPGMTRVPTTVPDLWLAQPNGRFLSRMARWEASFYQLELPLQASAPGSRLLITVEAAPLIREMQASISPLLAVLLAVTLGAILFARWVATQLSRPVVALLAATQALPQAISDGQTAPVRVSSTLVELNALTAAINAMGTSLATSFAKLHTKRQRLANVVKGTRAGTWEWTLATNEVMINARWAKLLGYQLDELTPTTLETWRRLTHPDDAERILALVQAHLRGETAFMAHELRMRHKDGHWVWIYAQGRVVERDATEAPTRLAGIHLDISKRKQLEEELLEHKAHLEQQVEQRTCLLNEERQRLAHILEGTQVGTWEWHVPTGAIHFNSRWAEMLGYGLAELAPVSIQTWQRLTHPDDLQRSTELLQRHFDGALDYYECEARMRHKDGHWVWMLDRGKVVTRDAAGQPLFMAGTHQDITRIKQAEQALIRAKDQALHLAQAKSEFLANMSHEIRTPMNAVLGLAYVLSRQALPEEARALARKIHQSGQNLLGLLNDILDLSKIDSNKLEIEHIPLRITEIFDGLATIMAATAGDKALELILIPPLCAERPLYGDPLRLSQVLINLTNNAIKFTDSGLVEVRVEHITHHDNQGLLRFVVRDTGIGIDPATQTQLFQPFTQADATTTRRFGGSGLGLAISRRLVERMGGQIGVESTLGAGSTFWFELPCTFVAEADPDWRQPLDRAVLVVAEHPGLRDSALATVAALGGTGVAVAAAEAAQRQVLADVKWQNPEAVVLLTGHQAADEARALAAALPASRRPLLLWLAAAAAPEPWIPGDGSALEAMLTKPLAPTAFYDAIAQARARRLDEPGVAAQQPTPQVPRLAGLRLLVVDDSEINREVAQCLFAGEGAHIQLAGNGQEALDWLLAHPQEVDLVLMDVQMPVMDGHEATRSLRQHKSLVDLPIIALTAGALAAQEDAARAAGMDAFVAKPIDIEQAVAVILRLVRGSPQAAAPSPSTAPPVMPDPEDRPELALGRALALWKDAAVYRRYLRKFAAEYSDIDAHITTEPAQARPWAHKLKGAAANLGLVEVAAQAGQLEHLAATSAPLASATRALQAALARARVAIAEYAPEPLPQHRDHQLPACDITAVAPQLRAAHAALTAFDPISAEPLVDQLAGPLTAESLAPLRAAIDHLDATAGEAAARVLAEQLGISL